MPFYVPFLCAGTQFHRGSAADLLVSARFLGYTRACDDNSIDSPSAAPCEALVQPLEGAPQWINGDFVVSATLSQSRVDAQRRVRGHAALDLFLCGDAGCDAVADLQYVSAGIGDGNGSLAAGYSRIDGTLVGLPLGWLEPARATSDRVAACAVEDSIERMLPPEMQGDASKDITIKKVGWRCGSLTHALSCMPFKQPSRICNCREDPLQGTGALCSIYTLLAYPFPPSNTSQPGSNSAYVRAWGYGGSRLVLGVCRASTVAFNGSTLKALVPRLIVTLWCLSRSTNKQAVDRPGSAVR